MAQLRHLRLVPGRDANLEAGRRALARWDWQEARCRFTAALESGETAEAHDGLGTALCWLGEIPAALPSYERTFALYQQREAQREAARQALSLAVEYAGSLGEDAVANGWLCRARRLLAGLEPGPEHAWLALWEGHIAFVVRDDLATGRQRLAEALELARSLGLREVELFAVGLEGMTLVAEGRVAEGLQRLDEAATAAGTNTAWAGPWGVSFTANLTPDENTGIGIWTEDIFMNTIRNGRHWGVARPLPPPMPWQAYRELTDEDLKSVYAYLRSIPPIHNRVPQPLSPAEPAHASAG